MITVIIPFYNGAITLNRVVESMKNQIFKGWELILVDDGSTDDSATLAKEYLSDSRIRYVFQENQGVSVARNHGAALASTEWLIFLDVDDNLEKDSLNIVIDQIRKKHDYGYFLFGMRRIKRETIIIQVPEDGIYFPKLAGTFVIKKSVFEEIGGYDRSLKFSENTELFHRIGLMGYFGVSSQNIILNYYDSPTGGSKNLQNMSDSLLIFLEKHNDTLSIHVKHLYHQIIGVNCMRFRNFSNARKHLWKAVQYKPKRIATWGRLGLAFLPFLAKRLYSKTVKHD